MFNPDPFYHVLEGIVIPARGQLPRISGMKQTKWKSAIKADD
jgi:hypothetical protein